MPTVAIVDHRTLSAFRQASDVPDGSIVLSSPAHMADLLSTATMNRARRALLGDDALPCAEADEAAVCLWIALESTVKRSDFSRFFRFDAVESGKLRTAPEAYRYSHSQENLLKLSKLARTICRYIDRADHRCFSPQELEDYVIKNCSHLLRNRPRTLDSCFEEMRLIWRRGNFNDPAREGRSELVKAGALLPCNLSEKVEEARRLKKRYGDRRNYHR